MGLRYLRTVQPKTTALTPSTYVFNRFVSPTGLGTNDGTSPTQKAGNVGPWPLTMINSMPGSTQLGVVADQGPYSFSSLGIPFNIAAFFDSVLQIPSGTPSAPTVVAACNSSGIYCGPAIKFVLDGSCNNPPAPGAYGYDPYYQGAGGGSLIGCTFGAGNAILDSAEIKNAAAGGFLSEPSTLMNGVQCLNCLVHHIYNYNEGFSAIASLNDVSNPGRMTVTTINGGFVNDINHSGAGLGGTRAVGTSADFVADKTLANNPQYGVVQPYGTSGSTGSGLTGTYQLSALVATLNFTASVGGATSGTFVGTLRADTFIFKFSDGETRVVTVSGQTATWAGALSAGSITSAAVYGFFNSKTVTGSAQAGNNLAAIKMENSTNDVCKKCFVYAVVDLNTSLANNVRSEGYQFWEQQNMTLDQCTVYADPVTQQPVEGFQFKNSGQFNLTITRNLASQANARTDSAFGAALSADLLAGAGHFVTATNNILIHPQDCGFKDVTGGSGQGYMNIPILWANNTCIMSNPAAQSFEGFQRFAPAGAYCVTHFGNIYQASNGGTPGSNGIISGCLDTFSILDYDMVPAAAGPNGQVAISPSGSGSPLTQYQLPSQAAALKTRMGAGIQSPAEGNVMIGTPTYINGGTGNQLKAADFQLAPASFGKGGSTTNGLASGSPTDPGAWGSPNGVAPGGVGCPWMDPF
jgi:hypothetical protein